MSTAAPRAPGLAASAPGRFDDAPFIRACRGQSVPHVPVWFMRQAGRSLPEYRAARGPGSILDAIAQPELVAALTRQPVDRYGTDAAIFFSDIVVPAAAVGFGVDVAPGTGPVVSEPFRAAADLDRLRPLEPEIDTPYVLEAVALLRDSLDVPLIGFAGGPFTVASYLVEGGPSKNFTRVKALMHADLEASHPGTPTILFGVGTGELLGLMATAGTSVVGVDWRVPLDEARRRV